MPNRDMSPSGATEGIDQAQCASSASAVAQDFAALAKIFDRQLKLVSPSDHETRSCIEKAKEAAERGLRLSQQLIDGAKSRS